MSGLHALRIKGRSGPFCVSGDLCPNDFALAGLLKALQKFASVHASLHNHFQLERHLVDRQTYKQRRSAAWAEWQSLVA